MTHSGIDPDKFIDSMEKSSVKQQIDEYKEQFRGRKVLIGIDRLDYIKGIYNKLLGVERFLEQHPEWVGKVVLVQVAVPSRTDVPEYKRLRRTTHELVARINGKFGDINTQPIHYLDQSVPFDRMVAIYRFSDAALITSIRDGMNLVAFEYVVAQKDQGGALILSEFAGAAQSLGAGCITFNPWSLQEVADAIYMALAMTDEDARQREAIMFDYVVNHTARHWVGTSADSRLVIYHV
jgi:trehalose-6-phosphate synthase